MDKKAFFLLIFMFLTKIIFGQKITKGIVKYSIIQYESMDTSELRKVQSHQTFVKLLNELPDDTRLVDSMDIENLRELFLLSDKKMTFPLYFKNVQFNNEVVWSKDLSFEGKILDFAKILFDGRKLYYKPTEPPKYLKDEDLFAFDYYYEIKVDSTDRKKILNYDCFKVVMTEKSYNLENFDKKVPELIFEMYVTDKIQLPLHCIIPVKKMMRDFFPLEISYYFSDSKIITYYKANAMQ